MGPEGSIKAIFLKARQCAPCYLIFEDLDTIVTDQVRSYFLNEVDGLKSNDGIFMIGSTNHLERLDPGISVWAPLLLILTLAKLGCRNDRLVSTESTTSPTRT
jgi:SpoVK/Ycf46/Vps4 family AAA+-type ATPase